MTKTTNIIEINNQRYDVVTGAKVVASPGKKSSGRSIDGMMSAPKAKVAPRAARTVPAASPKPSPTPPKQPLMDISRPRHNHANPHKPQTTHTLRRDSVSKPAPAQHFKATHANASAVVKHTPYTPALKTASHVVNPDRAARAAKISQSDQVRRFSGATAVKTVAPAAPAAVSRSVAPAPKAAHPSMDIFERALALATSHEQPVVRAKRRHTRRGRVLGYASASLAVLLLAGFVAWQNVANVELHMASSKAGFAATMPGYRPAGFSLGKLSYSAGNVALNFHSNSDSRHYALVEKTSDWDSQTLRDSFVASASSDQYQTVEASGRTIYVYGHDNATWVNGGVWYQVSTNGALNDRQLVSIATSM